MNLIPNILSSGDKIIVVSQWTSFLDIFGIQLDRVGIKFSKLDGKVPTAKRTEMVTFFNDPNTRVKVHCPYFFWRAEYSKINLLSFTDLIIYIMNFFQVLLLSLTAGGVGLNLVGANHLFLLDLHWNPQLENQAQDRIYRMGQKKNVNIYKYMSMSQFSMNRLIFSFIGSWRRKQLRKKSRIYKKKKLKYRKACWQAQKWHLVVN